MKEENNKEKNENYYVDLINNIISSPKQKEKDSIINTSPDKNSMNQKYFPLKENYFGIKASPSNNFGKLSSPSHSPILNYYAGLELSPKGDSFGFHSPKNECNICNTSNNFSGKLSPNFNYSPSTIFVNNNKDRKNSLQNFSLNSNTNNNEEDSKTLKEKMAPLVGKTDVNNFIRIGSSPSNSIDDNKNENQEEDNGESSDENEEVFTLRIDNFDEDFIAEAYRKKSINSNESKQKKSSIDILMNNNLSNSINQNNNQNNNVPKIDTKQDNKNNDITEDKNLVKNIINKQEFKPYIPNKYRNNPQNINNVQNPSERKGLSYLEAMDMQNYIANNYKDFNPEALEYLKYQNNKIRKDNNNKFSLDSSENNNDSDNEKFYNNFYYNGDNYKISNFKEYKKKDYLKTGEIPSIGAADIVTAITANNKKIKRIDPNTYLNESIEYLSYNIFPLAKDQAGCRFLQETLEKDPIHATGPFYKAILPFILPLVKDPFGNYLVQKLFNYLTPEQMKKIIEIIAPTVLDVGSNSHGTRVLQNLVNYLTTKELVYCYLNSIKPYVIPLLKELNGTHIINKFVQEHKECAEEINKIIIDNCSLLATHKHGCCILQKMLESPDRKTRNQLISKLIENCFVLIIDQFGNYVIQSILLLNEKNYSSAIAMKICDNIPYYSKHRYSSNVIEKCLDFCGKKEKKLLIDKICTPEIISDLILDEHGNYVIQKALYYSEYKNREIILNNIKPLIPKIRNTSFGEKLLYRLYSLYPNLNPNPNEVETNSLYNYVDLYPNKSRIKGKKKRQKRKKNDGNIENDEKDKYNNNSTIQMNNDSIKNKDNINNNIGSTNENKGKAEHNNFKNNIICENQSIENTTNNNTNSEIKKKKKKKKKNKNEKEQKDNENNHNEIKGDSKNDVEKEDLTHDTDNINQDNAEIKEL